MRHGAADRTNREHLQRMAISLGVVTGFDTDAMPEAVTTYQCRYLIESFLDSENDNVGAFSVECLHEIWGRIKHDWEDDGATGRELRALIADHVGDGEGYDPSTALRKPALQAVAMELAHSAYEADGHEGGTESAGFFQRLLGDGAGGIA